MNPHNQLRKTLDRLFAFDAASSVAFGVVALLAPHGIVKWITGGAAFYSHGVHETLR
jgi:hypothetical protein